MKTILGGTFHFWPLLLAVVVFVETAAAAGVPLFPEPSRFPASFIESKRQGPIVAVLLPAQRRDVHLRACAILGARFGQLRDFSENDVRVALIQDWQTQTQERNGVILGRRDELDALPIPERIRETLASVSPGHGLVAEFILGEFPNQRRWLLTSGADDAGLEKAILTLGSAQAMAEAPPNPAVIETEPIVSAADSKNGSNRERIAELKQLNQFLLQDRFLRKVAFLLPANASLSELQMFFELSMHLGRSLPSSQTLWPEVAAYSAGAPPLASRLQGRSVLLLGQVARWKDALPHNVPLAIEIPAGRSDVLRMQGRNYGRSAMEPTLTFAQMIPSPWSRAETLLVAGGWDGFATSGLKRLLTDPAVITQLHGDICATDASGRLVVYNSRRISAESLAERIQKRIPPGLGVEETNRRLKAQESRSTHSTRINTIIFVVTGSILTLVVACRVLLLREIARVRKEASGGEKRLGSAP